MKRQEFNQLLEQRCRKTQELFNRKNKEYAREDDIFENFKDAARILKTSEAKALWGMLIKHIISVQAIIEREIADEELVNEKIGDIITYMVLLEGILKEGRK